jgi:hypothetical protein
MLGLTKVINWLFDVTAAVKGADDTLVFSFGPIRQPNAPPTPRINPFVGLELIFGNIKALSFLGGFGALSLFRRRSPMACCAQFFTAFGAAVVESDRFWADAISRHNNNIPESNKIFFNGYCILGF